MPLSNYAKDNFVAPHLSDFTSAKIEDLSAYILEQKHWLSNFILNSSFKFKVPRPERDYILSFLQRAQTAFEEYELARIHTEEFLARQESGYSSYFSAHHHWEITVNLIWQSVRTLHLLTKAPGKPFPKGDNSSLEARLNSIANSMKHAEERIERGEMPSDGGLSVWLTNKGLKSTKSHLDFEELADYLKQLGEAADTLSSLSQK